MPCVILLFKMLRTMTTIVAKYQPENKPEMKATVKIIKSIEG